MHRISQLVADRPVGILAPGPSIRHLQARAGDFGPLDVCWASLNHFSLMEEMAVGMNRSLDIVFVSAPVVIAHEEAHLKRFVSRPTNSLWITSHNIAHERILVDDSAGHGRFNTMACFLFCLMRAGVKDIYLFGCDGGNTHNGDAYFQQERVYFDPALSTPAAEIPAKLSRDSVLINGEFWNFCKAHSVPSSRIWNVCEDSYITAFPRISYDRAVANLTNVPRPSASTPRNEAQPVDHALCG